MCGIVGYAGRRKAAPLIIDGLRRLEYRGYDSFGVATVGSHVEVYKRRGRIPASLPEARSMKGTLGIGHTRWATHGAPSDENAHPHTDCTGRIAVVHNGIIENYASLRKKLEKEGHTFRSETDTEVIAHLIEEHYGDDLLGAVQEAVGSLEGSWAFLAVAEGDRRIVAARQASPLVLGLGDGETLAASDMTPLLEFTERVVFPEDGDIVSITPQGAEICNGGRSVERPVELVDWCADDVRKGGFEHYMLKEIFEQPRVFYETVRAADPSPLVDLLGTTPALTIVACGTSYHAGLVAKYLVEEFAGIPVRVEHASEFRYAVPPLLNPVLAVTQSGETADTLWAVRAAKSRNCPTVALTNVVGSTVTRLADASIFTRAGPEVGVAATKSFIAQLAVFMALADRLGGGKLAKSLGNAHLAIGDLLGEDVGEAVAVCRRARSIFFIGRGPFYPVALEGALKMKEISYIHAEGYAAGELKHGPFALLTPETPAVALCLPGPSYRVMLSNIKEIKARGAPVIGIGLGGDRELADVVDVLLPVTGEDPWVQVLTASVLLQLLAYHTAKSLETDIDRPRNLAKSVTVE
ncbi:MAG TPA: glutamine--fructose-6-phosphate transaminase (isomerizing) [Methanomicrobiales archaeon]|jgi:glucosamine--fructose-6-phosphate aminotransferase (isomerizing)|nr:glutamine--fructose-6-phosphate transaminase (isomerizing) [Methanomicrobiales archaeon]